MVVKVSKHRLSSMQELAVARNVCRKNLKGLAVFEDYGIINDDELAESLGALPSSIFIVYKKVEHSLVDLWRGHNRAMSM